MITVELNKFAKMSLLYCTRKKNGLYYGTNYSIFQSQLLIAAMLQKAYKLAVKYFAHGGLKVEFGEEILISKCR